jgi:hypothetical protein
MTTSVYSKPDGSLALQVNGSEVQTINNTNFTSTFNYNVQTGSSAYAGFGGAPANARVYIAGGNSTVAQMDFAGGSLQTSPLAGSVEFDGNTFYMTSNTTSGRGFIPVAQAYALSANAANVTVNVTGTNYFGANTNIPLIANAIYQVEINAYFRKTTSGTVGWQLVFDNAPTIWNMEYMMSPIGGAVAPPGTATTLAGQAIGQTVNNYTVTTGIISSTASIWTSFKLFVVCSSSTTKLQIFNYGNTVTPLAGSFWRVTRFPDTNVGTYLA